MENELCHPMQRKTEKMKIVDENLVKRIEELERFNLEEIEKFKSQQMLKRIEKLESNSKEQIPAHWAERIENLESKQKFLEVNWEKIQRLEEEQDEGMIWTKEKIENLDQYNKNISAAVHHIERDETLINKITQNSERIEKLEISKEKTLSRLYDFDQIINKLKRFISGKNHSSNKKKIIVWTNVYKPYKYATQIKGYEYLYSNNGYFYETKEGATPPSPGEDFIGVFPLEIEIDE